MEHRPLKDNEINALEEQGCSCSDWSGVLVSKDFKTQYIQQVRFDGQVRLGTFDARPIQVDGLHRYSGLYNSFIRNCEIHDEVYISNVGLLSDYEIRNSVILENISTLEVYGETSFGQGIMVEVLNEGGGREIPIFDRLSSQLAYILVLYRHNLGITERIEKLISTYCKNKTSNRGLISEGCSITDSQTIRNVWFGDGAVISGAQLLENGTVASHPADPVKIGAGVLSRNFIALSGAEIGSGAILEKCFVGQGVHIGKQFSAEQSVFFANSEAFHGEAVSLFAGPYTVSHHKSSLLIAGMFSFFNAGSGTNQSNHMYKLGPVHQGVLERGCKTGSFAYLLWPSRVGAFSVVMDKHNSNFDTSDLPFSYLNKDGDRSVLTPAMNLFTVGTRRDSEKWPKRDRRKNPDKIDLIRFDLFNPYTIAKMIRGSEILSSLYEQTPREHKYVQYKGAYIPRLLLKTGNKYYALALQKYYGDMVLNRLHDENPQSMEGIQKALSADNLSDGSWVDMAGLIAPASEMDTIMAEVENSQITDIRSLEKRLEGLHNNYNQLSWSWFASLIKDRKGIELSKINSNRLIEIIKDWKESSLKLNNMILRDAEKEFDANSRIGYGIDGDTAVQQRDFDSVRGTVDGNVFIQSLKKENEAIEEKAAYWLGRLGEQSNN